MIRALHTYFGQNSLCGLNKFNAKFYLKHYVFWVIISSKEHVRGQAPLAREQSTLYPRTIFPFLVLLIVFPSGGTEYWWSLHSQMARKRLTVRIFELHLHQWEERWRYSNMTPTLQALTYTQLLCSNQNKHSALPHCLRDRASTLNTVSFLPNGFINNGSLLSFFSWPSRQA